MSKHICQSQRLSCSAAAGLVGVATLTTVRDSVAQESNPEDRDSTFKPDQGGGNVASGEVLLVEAYAVIWLLAFGLIASSVRKQRQLDKRIDQLQAELAKVRDGDG